MPLLVELLGFSVELDGMNEEVWRMAFRVLAQASGIERGKDGDEENWDGENWEIARFVVKL